MTFKLTGRHLEKALKSRQFRDGKFHNAHQPVPSLSADTLSLMGDFLFGGKKRMPPGPVPLVDPVPVWQTTPRTGLRVTWLGHSSLFLEIDGARILIDPMFGMYAAPFPLVGRKRFHPVPARLRQFPTIDAIIQSHDHYDHLSAKTWRRIAKLGVPVVTPIGVGQRLEKFGVDESLITEVDWWEDYSPPGTNVKITAAPAQHFSGRTVGDRNSTLWASWVIAGDAHKVFFSGDTGLNPDLTNIGERFGPFDLTLLEIGASNPAWADIHLGPANAVKAFGMLGGGTLLPIHWGTFDLALHPWSEPPETLLQIAARDGLRLITPKVGEPVEPAEIHSPAPWWRDVRPPAD
jgi:L-ascorbate metabolism protein UlaG (beta-lactamase superfamily)